MDEKPKSSVSRSEKKYNYFCLVSIAVLAVIGIVTGEFSPGVLRAIGTNGRIAASVVLIWSLYALYRTARKNE